MNPIKSSFEEIFVKINLDLIKSLNDEIIEARLDLIKSLNDNIIEAIRREKDRINFSFDKLIAQKNKLDEIKKIQLRKQEHDIDTSFRSHAICLFGSFDWGKYKIVNYCLGNDIFDPESYHKDERLWEYYFIIKRAIGSNHVIEYQNKKVEFGNIADLSARLRDLTWRDNKMSESVCLSLAIENSSILEDGTEIIVFPHESWYQTDSLESLSRYASCICVYVIRGSVTTQDREKFKYFSRVMENEEWFILVYDYDGIGSTSGGDRTKDRVFVARKLGVLDDTKVNVDRIFFLSSQEPLGQLKEFVRFHTELSKCKKDEYLSCTGRNLLNYLPFDSLEYGRFGSSLESDSHTLSDMEERSKYLQSHSRQAAPRYLSSYPRTSSKSRHILGGLCGSGDSMKMGRNELFEKYWKSDSSTSSDMAEISRRLFGISYSSSYPCQPYRSLSISGGHCGSGDSMLTELLACRKRKQPLSSLFIGKSPSPTLKKRAFQYHTETSDQMNQDELQTRIEKIYQKLKIDLTKCKESGIKKLMKESLLINVMDFLDLYDGSLRIKIKELHDLHNVPNNESVSLNCLCVSINIVNLLMDQSDGIGSSRIISRFFSYLGDFQCQDKSNRIARRMQEMILYCLCNYYDNACQRQLKLIDCDVQSRDALESCFFQNQDSNKIKLSAAIVLSFNYHQMDPLKYQQTLQDYLTNIKSTYIHKETDKYLGIRGDLIAATIREFP